MHIYICIECNDLEVLKEYLEVKLWSGGLGYIALAKNGARLKRTIIDLAVLGQERLIFVAPPIVGPGLDRHPKVLAKRAGPSLKQDPNITETEREACQSTIAMAKANLVKQSDETYASYRQSKVTELAKLKSILSGEADGLIPNHSIDEREAQSLTLTDNDVVEIRGESILVSELLSRGPELDGSAMPDPVEGSAYGATTAKFYYNDRRNPCIHSFAHGQNTTYRFKPPNTCNKPEIHILGGSLSKNLDTTIEAVANVNPPTVYQRGQTLCRVAHLDEDAEIQGCSIPIGTANITRITKNRLTVEIAQAANWKRPGKTPGEWEPSDPCPKVCGALLDSVGLWLGIPCLLGISEPPILKQDGSLISQAGYDETTRLYVEGRVPDIVLPSRPDLNTAQNAAKLLLAPFEEFPFVDAELDQSVLLAYLFTLAMRPQINTAPLFCVSATTPGTGKGLLIEIANLIVRGRDVSTMPPVQGSAGEEETRKRITALLSQGVASINLDNWTKPIGGESLNALLTATEWTDRILGRSESVTLPNRITLAATGNNLSVFGDMTRRSLLIQLDANVERPELREFKEKDLPGRVLKDRKNLLTALYTIMSAFQQAGSPGRDENMLGRFEAWSSAVCAPIRWLGYPDPLSSQERLRDEDPESDRLQVVLSNWWAVFGDSWTTASGLISLSENTFGPNKDTHRANLIEALSEICTDGRGNMNQKTLGWFLRRFTGRVLNGYKLEKKPRDSKSKHAHQYRVVQLGSSRGMT
jgi:hypothetical protein